jgi:aldose 1-epimerase
MTRKIIHHGELELEIETLGARIISFTNKGQEVMKTAKNELQGYNGMVLAPWPNRIADGKYSHRGQDYQLEINEIDRNNALHGFAFQTEFEVTNQTDNQINLSTVLTNKVGYPFEILLRLEYKLDSNAFSCHVNATNQSATDAPFGIAFHPYYPVDNQTQISIPAKTHILTDQQMIPIGSEPNPHKTFRFADVDFDDCFSELDRDNGIAEMTIESSEQLITLWQDEAFDFVMVYTTNEFDDLHGHKQALAIEAQSCIANAFNTNPPLLKPGKSFIGSWGVIHTFC